MNLPRGITVLKAAALVGLLLQGMLLLRPDRLFIVRPLIEDAFYSMTVAAHIAAGNGISIDGHHPTNGIQPLISFLYAPIYALLDGDRYAALRWVTILQSVIYACATFAIAWFFATCMRHPDLRREVFWLAAALTAWSITLLNHMLNGLETGLAAALVFASVAWYNDQIASVESPNLRSVLVLGLVLGLGVLARIDVAFLVPAILIHHLWRGGGSKRHRMANVVMIGAISLLASAPWWIYNVVTFGSLMPISGQAQESIFQGRRWIVIRTTLDAVADSFVLTTHLPYSIVGRFPALGIVVLATIVVLGVAVTRTQPALRRSFASWTEYWSVDRALPLLCFTLALIVYYAFMFGAPHFTVRYLISFRIAAGLSVVSLLYLLWHFSDSPALRGLLVAVIVSAMVITAVGFRMNFTGSHGNLVADRVDWIGKNLPPDASIGMFQSGTVAYFNNRVVNLDGKVNAAALYAMRQGRLAAYVDSMHFSYLVEWPELLEDLLSDPVLRGKYRRVATLADRTVVYRRSDATSSGLPR